MGSPEEIDDTVEVWVAAGEPDERATARFEPLLSGEERERAARYRKKASQRRYVAVRGLLRELLAARLGCRPAEVRIAEGKGAKPRLAPESGRFFFNCSHAKGLSLIALSALVELGVDVERLRPLPIEELLPRCLAPSERAYFAALSRDEALHRFFTLWTRKEALLKGVGLGLALSPVQVELSWPGPRLLSMPPSLGSGWRLYSLEVGEGYAAALAAPHEALALSIRRLSLEGAIHR